MSVAEFHYFPIGIYFLPEYPLKYLGTIKMLSKQNYTELNAVIYTISVNLQNWSSFTVNWWFYSSKFYLRSFVFVFQFIIVIRIFLEIYSQVLWLETNF